MYSFIKKYKFPILLIVAVTLFLIALIPVVTTCGAASYSCAMPNPEGSACWYTETEPLGIKTIETAFSTNFRIYYSSETICS